MQMAFKLGMTGMDQASETALREAFEQVSGGLGGRWTLVAEAEADHVIVDMDSMYGPMSWIRLHAAGKQVIGLTTAARTQADHRLQRPFDAEALGDILKSIAGSAPEPAEASIEAESAEAPPSSSTPAPAPADELPEEAPAAANAEADAPPGPAAALEPAASEPAAAEPETAPSGDTQATPEPEPEPEPEPALEPEPAPSPPRERTLADWLAPGMLQGRWRYRFDGGQVSFDADDGKYHGPTALKPLAAAFDQVVDEAALERLDDKAWESATAEPGETQPLSRLRWYGGLLAGKGTLLPGNDPHAEYRLVKWPQTEREFPRHFRIATAMMKGPATLPDIATASNVPEAEVADFVNANLATGFAEVVQPPPPEPDEPAKPGGLFGRLRGR